MIVKKKSEETERKRTYTKRVLELLYPEEHASSALSVDERGGGGSGSVTAADEGSGAATESQSEIICKGETSISTVEVTKKVQPRQKMYGVSSPPADHQLSAASQGDLQDETADVECSSSEDQELFNVSGDISSTRRRRRHKRRKTSHGQPTTSAEAQPSSTVTQSKSAATFDAIEPMSKNRKRKLKKKLKLAERKPAPSSEFVYKDIHEITRIENNCLDVL